MKYNQFYHPSPPRLISKHHTTKSSYLSAPIAQRPPAHPWFGHPCNNYYHPQDHHVLPYSPIQSHPYHPPVPRTVVCNPTTAFQTKCSSKNQEEQDKLRISKCISDVRDVDVLCGRGVPSKYHAGNHYFQFLIDSYQSQYIAARRCDKPLIAFYVVDLIMQERGGRFLKRTPMPPRKDGEGDSKPIGGGWEDIGRQRAYEKVCQALREGAPDVRRQWAAKEMAAADVCCKKMKDKDAAKCDPTRIRSNGTHDNPGALLENSPKFHCFNSWFVEGVSSEVSI